MTRLQTCLLGCALLVPAAHAAPPQWGGSISLSSDYLLRGVSHNGNDPAFSAEVHALFNGRIFAGAGLITSRVSPQADTTPELSATLGIAGVYEGNWIARFSVTHYENPWSAFPEFYRYDEFTAELAWRDRWQVMASYSPNASRYSPGYGAAWHANTFAYETSYQHPLRSGLSLFAGAGYNDLDELVGAGYWYASVGASVTRNRWRFDLSWVMPESAAESLSWPGTADDRLLATLTRIFVRP